MSHSLPDCRPANHPEHLPWPPELPDPYPYPPVDPETGRSITSKEPFNEALAREKFGDEYVYELKGRQSEFKGDWFQLAYLLRCHETEAQKRCVLNEYGKNKCGCPFCQSHWKQTHLENAKLRKAHLEYAMLLRAHLENAISQFAHLEYADLGEAHLENAQLQEANLKNATLWKAHLENADLEEAHLENAQLQEVNLKNATLWKAHFENAKLKRAHLENAYLREADLKNANLQRAHLENADLGGAHLENVYLYEADLKNANLQRADLENANLWAAHLENANLQYAHLENANLQFAHLENATLQGANLNGAILKNAYFDGADVRRAQGIVFDSTEVDRIRIEGNAPDPWSVLRRTYTGPKFFVLLAMFVAAIVVPYAAKYFYLTMESEIIIQTDKLVQSPEFQQRLENSQDLKPFTETFEALKEKHDHSIKVPAILVMLGVQKNVVLSIIQVFLSLVIIVYIVARAFLTIKISTLRDVEERSKITPSKGEYLRFYKIHRWVTYIMYLSLVYASYRGLLWCVTTWVPLT